MSLVKKSLVSKAHMKIKPNRRAYFLPSVLGHLCWPDLYQLSQQKYVKPVRLKTNAGSDLGSLKIYSVPHTSPHL